MFTYICLSDQLRFGVELTRGRGELLIVWLELHANGRAIEAQWVVEFERLFVEGVDRNIILQLVRKQWSCLRTRVWGALSK